ncbi:MAG: hypothetical protein H7A21_04845 [Spirochaetales bacterium]|nr:hypothetical protein [Leptospiraceae bacterium]MCP5480741.1 hypothetical protein [Spirochaetales bacterium]MCP5484093.1 hypothetical protein [Spirochaetales bacterium]
MQLLSITSSAFAARSLTLLGAGLALLHISASRVDAQAELSNAHVGTWIGEDDRGERAVFIFHENGTLDFTVGEYSSEGAREAGYRDRYEIRPAGAHFQVDLIRLGLDGEEIVRRPALLRFEDHDSMRLVTPETRMEPGPSACLYNQFGIRVLDPPPLAFDGSGRDFLLDRAPNE